MIIKFFFIHHAAEARDVNFQDGPFARQSRRGLDSLSGATFGQNKRFDSR